MVTQDSKLYYPGSANTSSNKRKGFEASQVIEQGPHFKEKSGRQFLSKNSEFYLKAIKFDRGGGEGSGSHHKVGIAPKLLSIFFHAQDLSATPPSPLSSPCSSLMTSTKTLEIGPMLMAPNLAKPFSGSLLKWLLMLPILECLWVQPSHLRSLMLFLLSDQHQ